MVNVFLILTFLGVFSCFHDSDSDSNSEISIDFVNPNGDATFDNTHSVEVFVVQKSGDTLEIYSGTKLNGPWNAVIKSENVILIIMQLDENGIIVGTSTYSYEHENGNIKIFPMVEIFPPTAELILGGDPFILKLKVFPSTNSQTATWTSEDETVVRVSQEGVLTSIGVGETQIVATKNNFKSDTVFVTVVDTSGILAPEITGHPQDDTVMVGGSASFMVVATGEELVYQWEKNGEPIAGANQSSLTIQSVSLTESGDLYKCSVSNSAGSILSTSATLVVLDIVVDAPKITADPQGASAVLGDSVSFSVIAEGSDLVYKWYKNGIEITGVSSTTLVYSVEGSTDNGAEFYCIVSNGGGADTSEVAALTIVIEVIPPSITTQPQNISATEGESAVFEIIATGTSLKYQWQIDGLDIAGATSSNYEITEVSATENGSEFSCLVYNSADTIQSDAANLTVNFPPVITTDLENQTVNLGDKATFTIVATGTEPLSYQWRKNGAVLNGITSSTYTTDSVTGADDGNIYSVTVNNVTGIEAISSNAVLTVNLPPTISVQPVAQAVNSGSNVAFSVIASGTEPILFQWRKDGVDLIGATENVLEILNASESSIGNYSVLVSNSVGVVTSDIVSLAVLFVPTVNTSNVINITFNSGIAGGNVISDGGAPVTSRGVCWGINANPDLNGTCSSSGIGDGVFTIDIENLQSSTSYNVRAYAINSVGVSYGENLIFNTHWACGDSLEFQGRNYNTKLFESGCWTTENINYDLPGAETYCYDNDISNCEEYGRLYLINDSNQVCPDGWVLPTIANWDELVNEFSQIDSGKAHVPELISSLTWTESGGISESTSEFNIKASGYRQMEFLTFHNLNVEAVFMTSSLYYAYFSNAGSELQTYSNLLFWDNSWQNWATSVRCIKQ